METKKAEIFYYDIGDYLDREQKLSIIGSYAAKGGFFALPVKKITPNEYSDWVTTRNEAFVKFLPINAEKKFNLWSESFFVTHSGGYKTNRDVWIYNFSKETLLSNAESFINYFNSEIKKGKENVTYDSAKIAFNDTILRNSHIEFQSEKFTLANYRPFCKQNFYFGEKVIEARYLNERFFPTPNHKNLLICLTGIGSSKEFSCIITDSYTDLEIISKSQCFPLYYYEKVQHDPNQGHLDDNDYIQKDGISDWILRTAKDKYEDEKITKEDIFYYVYGFLHLPSYRETFADDLKKSLPKLSLVEKSEDFWSFSKAGRELAKLHLDYENVKPLKSVKVDIKTEDYTVLKMRFPNKSQKNSSSVGPSDQTESFAVPSAKHQKDTIIYNNSITVENIPDKAYSYVVNGKSAIEWIMERYQVKTDKDSGIINDPNLWCEEQKKPRYILDLLLSVIAVSIKTVDIVEKLPSVSFGDNSEEKIVNKNGLRIAVVGSRSITDYDISKHLPSDISLVISGGASGVDKLAMEHAEKIGAKHIEFFPEYDKFKRAAPLKRNDLIVRMADEIYIFWDGVSKGSDYVIKKCEELGKKFKVIKVEVSK